MDEDCEFTETETDVYDAHGEWIATKHISVSNDLKSINDWIITTRKRNGEMNIGYMSAKGNDFQNVNYLFIINDKNQLPHPRGTWVTTRNICEIGVYLAVRKCIEASWLNERDQFLYPNDGWKTDKEFQSDCLAYTLFNNSINIQSKCGINHWIPFTEEEVDAKDNFESHFMSDYIRGKRSAIEKHRDGSTQTDFTEEAPEPIVFSTEAQAVMDAGRDLWRYYHAQLEANPNASFYDIRLHFQGTKTTKNGKEQMNVDSNNATYTNLISTLRQCIKVLAAKIEPKVYEYGFLLK